MTDRRVADIQAIIDAETRGLLALKVRGSNSSDLIDVSGISAITKVAGVSPDGGKDIPVASLATALGIPAVIGTVKKVAGLDPDGAGAISLANLRTAIAAAMTVAGVSPDGSLNIPVASLRTAIAAAMTVAGISPDGSLDIPVATLATAIAVAQTSARSMTWAQHITAGAGTYDGQRRRITVTAGGPNQVFEIEWDGARSVWNPCRSGDLIHVGAIVTDSNSTGTQSLTGTAWTAPAGLFRPPGAAGVGAIGLLIEVIAETSISATARTVTAQLDATASFVNGLAAAANRRVSGRWGFIPTDATHGFGITKADSSEYDFPQGANSNLVACDRTWANAIAVSLAVQFTTAASAATATLRRYKAFLVHG